MQSDKFSQALQVRAIALEYREMALNAYLAETSSGPIDAESALREWHTQNPLDSFIPTALDHLEKITDLIEQRETARRHKGANDWLESMK